MRKQKQSVTASFQMTAEEKEQSQCLAREFCTTPSTIYRMGLKEIWNKNKERLEMPVPFMVR